jgi:hypothetical protein
MGCGSGRRGPQGEFHLTVCEQKAQAEQAQRLKNPFGCSLPRRQCLPMPGGRCLDTMWPNGKTEGAQSQGGERWWMRRGDGES